MHTDTSQVSPETIAYSIDGAVAASGLSRTAIYDAMKAGQLEFRKFGKRRVVLADSLRRFIHGTQESK
jgi:hypothetical protein